MKVEILGTGCTKCETLAANARAAAESLNLPCEFAKVTDLGQIMSRGVMFTPALAIDGTVCSSGKVLTPAEIAALLTRHVSEGRS